MNPIDKQVDLLKTLLPKAKTVGVMYCSSEVNYQLQVSIMKKIAGEKGLTVKEATVTNVNDIQQAAQGLVAQGVDVIYIPTDNVMASAVPVLTKVTNAAKIPVIAGPEGRSCDHRERLLQSRLPDGPDGREGASRGSKTPGYAH